MGSLGGFLESLGAHLGALQGSEALIWVILGAAGRILEPLGALLGALGGSWKGLGRFLGGSWMHFGGIWGDVLELFWSLGSAFAAIC